MCGIAGILGGAVSADERLISALRMATAIQHRGPDGHGVWGDACGVALAHRRLAIIDVSEAGRQPMHSSSGRYVIVYNGEIYNFNELREVLASRGHSFRGHSDTEVLLAAVEEWGVTQTLRKLAGMFAIALWDRGSRALWLARDRLGEKPLYYGLVGSQFLFGSELKALVAHGAFSNSVNTGAVGQFLRLGYVPAPATIYQGIYKLPPGMALQVSLREGAIEPPAPEPFWSAADTYSAAMSQPFRGTLQDAVQELESRLISVVRSRMIADVPLGAFLSGGVDSSVVVALMQRCSSEKIRTFTISFPESEFDESPHAAAVARALGTDHTQLEVAWQDALSLVPQLPDMFDEPFGDSSQIPTHLLARLTRNHVTVALSGDGGDEVFGGYNRYFRWRQVHRPGLPKWSRQLLGRLIRGISAESWNRIFSPSLRRLLPRSIMYTNPGDRLHKLAPMLAADTAEDLYRMMVSQYQHPDELVALQLRNAAAVSRITAFGHAGSADAITHAMMLHDLQTYLPDDVLVKVDRATMAASLETRAPYLDHDLIAFAASLPLDFKVRRGEGKRVLKLFQLKLLPGVDRERAKAGFAVPIDSWLRGPLRDWGEDLLSGQAIARHGLLDAEEVRRLWGEHLSGRRQHQHVLWSVLMLQAWASRWLSSGPALRDAMCA